MRWVVVFCFLFCRVSLASDADVKITVHFGGVLAGVASGTIVRNSITKQLYIQTVSHVIEPPFNLNNPNGRLKLKMILDYTYPGKSYAEEHFQISNFDPSHVIYVPNNLNLYGLKSFDHAGAIPILIPIDPDTSTDGTAQDAKANQVAVDLSFENCELKRGDAVLVYAFPALSSDFDPKETVKPVIEKLEVLYSTYNQENHAYEVVLSVGQSSHPGASGGGVYDKNGTLVGVISEGRSTNIYSKGTGRLLRTVLDRTYASIGNYSAYFKPKKVSSIK